jgi:hypothetical protein
MSAVANILVESAIPVIIGISLLVMYRAHPERFPRRWTPACVTVVAIVLIFGSVLLAICDAYRRAH